MWLIPSYGRPDAPGRLLDAPGGMPHRVFVLVNEDDPTRAEYDQLCPFPFLIVPAGSRFADAVRFAFEQHPNEPYYGIIDDDYWPLTPGWHTTMVDAAGDTGIAIANNKQNFPSLYTCRVMGGALARAIGTIAPSAVRHNFSDDTWAKFADDFGLLRPLDDVIVEHRHHLFGTVEKDATYERGSKDFEEDRARYLEWLGSEERRLQCERVAALLGRGMTATDLRKMRLAICVPMQNMSVDFAFHRSFHNTMALLHKKGVSVSVFEVAGGSHVGKARERALWNAYRSEPQCSHFMWIDDDMGWDAKLIVRFLCAGHDFCGAAGVKKLDTLSLCFNPYPDPQTLHPTTKFLKVRHVGFAFVMHTRAVIDRLVEAYPDLRYNTGKEPPESALFLDMIWKSGDGPGERFSEDFSFCQRWIDIGGEIWLDQHAALIHAGRKEYTGKPMDVMREVAA